jgi:hypothetical protein
MAKWAPYANSGEGPSWAEIAVRTLGGFGSALRDYTSQLSGIGRMTSRSRSRSGPAPILDTSGSIARRSRSRSWRASQTLRCLEVRCASG